MVFLFGFFFFSAQPNYLSTRSSVATLGIAFLRIAEVETVVGMIHSDSAGGDEGCITLE